MMNRQEAIAVLIAQLKGIADDKQGLTVDFTTMYTIPNVKDVPGWVYNTRIIHGGW
jgi:hypothetical protein